MGVFTKMGTKPQVVKGAIGATIGIIALAGIAGAMGNTNNQQQQHATPVVQPVTYSDCRTEEIPFETQYDGSVGQYGYTESVKQQGAVGSKKICKPNKPGYQDKVEVVTQPTPHIVVRTPKPAPQPVQQQSHYRVGAICRDGWQSSATGRGACSHHGGVSEWLYE
jgi:hypothetical protein